MRRCGTRLMTRSQQGWSSRRGLSLTWAGKGYNGKMWSAV